MELAYQIKRPDLAIEAAKAANQKNMLMASGGFPVPCRSEFPVAHSFPPAFPLDTDHLSAALAAFNQRVGVKLRFDQLSNDEMRWVIQKAQQLSAARFGA